VNIPATIAAGTTVVWTDDATVDVLGAAVDSTTHSLTYYLRKNTQAEGVTISGVAYQSGWKVTLPAATTEAMDAGNWYFQAVATNLSDSTVLELGRGGFTVEASLAYSGTPGAFDGRSQLQQDLDAVKAAIRAIISGGAVAEYRIGNRNLKKFELTELMELESRLKAQLAREKKAELIANNLGNPHSLYVRFNQG
jgi:hypothetical protein